jgi:tetratricopeptide (TPR) repeat protein
MGDIVSKDILGNPLSYGDTAAIAAYDAAADKLLAYKADPLADIDAVIASHPRFVMARLLRAGMIATAGDTALAGMLRETLDGAREMMGTANARERAHLAALEALGEGDGARAADLWGRILFDHPRDTAALQFAHLSDFIAGQSAMLRDRPSWALRALDEKTPRHHFALGMRAFGLEECGEYDAAQRAGERAVAMGPHDAWSAHAVAHVHEMRGDTKAGIAWLESTSAGWAPENVFAFHIWWHLALLHLDRGDMAAALALYDAKVRPANSDNALELVDATAMLWRISALGGDTGGRWAPLAKRWESRIGHGGYTFNDAHAVMAFASAGRFDLAEAQIETLRRAARGGGEVAAMAAQVGVPLALGLLAFARGEYRPAFDRLIEVRPRAVRFGGSHAQRDLIAWTAVEAALRAGDERTASALIAERLAAKPASAVNLGWRKRVEATTRRAA